MIIIDKPEKIQNGDLVRVSCNIKENDLEKNVWFETEKEYGKYLVDDRIDAFVVGLLHYAMLNNHNIKSEFPITEELLYNINTILIPSLTNYADTLNKIEVNAPTVKAIEEGEANGTGISCGIDSFSAVKNHLNTNYREMDLDYLCLNNVGAYNECYDEYGKDKVKEERYKITEEVANELNIKLIKTNSNFAEAFNQVHYFSNTYSCCFAILMLQKLWKRYYLGSVGLDYSKFTIVDNDKEDSAHYDLLTLQCFSHSGIKIYSEGGEKNRIDKTRDIVDFKPAQKYLHVCLVKPYNCNTCSKCMRTLVTLDSLNKLDNFNQVFDIDYYKNNKKIYYKWLCKQHMIENEMNEPVYQELLKRKEFRNRTFFQRIFIIPIYKFLRKTKHLIFK